MQIMATAIDYASEISVNNNADFLIFTEFPKLCTIADICVTKKNGFIHRR